MPMVAASLPSVKGRQVRCLKAATHHRAVSWWHIRQWCIYWVKKHQKAHKHMHWISLKEWCSEYQWPEHARTIVCKTSSHFTCCEPNSIQNVGHLAWIHWSEIVFWAQRHMASIVQGIHVEPRKAMHQWFDQSLVQHWTASRDDYDYLKNQNCQFRDEQMLEDEANWTQELQLLILTKKYQFHG